MALLKVGTTAATAGVLYRRSLMRILAWNLQQGGGSRKPRIADRIIAHDPDVVALIEYVPTRAESFLRNLEGLGWPHKIAPEWMRLHSPVCRKAYGRRGDRND